MDACAICDESLVKSQRAICGCKHMFHDACLDGWATACTSRKLPLSCPLCRRPCTTRVVDLTDAIEVLDDVAVVDLTDAIYVLDDVVVVDGCNASSHKVNIIDASGDEDTPGGAAAVQGIARGRRAHGSASSAASSAASAASSAVSSAASSAASSADSSAASSAAGQGNFQVAANEPAAMRPRRQRRLPEFYIPSTI